MTPAEQAAQLARETRSSIELTRNSKGDYQWVLKRYHENTEEDRLAALADIEKTDTTLRAKYVPPPSDMKP